MATSNKSDRPSGSPGRPASRVGQRGAHAVASLDRSGSFRENKNRMLSRPDMSRSGSSLSQGDVTNFIHSLPLDTKMVASRQKFPQQVDVSRLVTTSLGISSDDSLSGSSATRLVPAPVEAIKRVKDTIRDSAITASGQIKLWEETISRFDKHFPSIWARRKARSDVQLTNRSNTILAGDRLLPGGTAAKLSTQSGGTSTGFDQEQQKLEEHTKYVVPNNRFRTSTDMDTRGNALGRPTGATNKGKEMSGLADGGPLQFAEKDQTLPVCVDGWDSVRTRKKRSGIKSDVSTNGVSNRTDGDREFKRETKPRAGVDARSRLSNIHGTRSGPSFGAADKLDVTSHQTGIVTHSPQRTDQDNDSPLFIRDRVVGAGIEKFIPKANNKLNVRESSSLASPVSTTKINPLPRMPKSGSGPIPKLSPNVQRPGVLDDWEMSQGTNKIQAFVGANNCKRTPSKRSQSPPSAQWGRVARQRPQKIPRRSNFIPLLAGPDEATNDISDVVATQNGTCLRRSPGISLQKVKFKGDQFSSVAFSENEEPAAAEIISKDKGKKASDDMDDKAGQNVHKAATLVPSSRKNRIEDEDLGDTVRRHGRTARGNTSARSSIPMSVDNLDSAVTSKQLRTTRLGCGKIERYGKVGRPPTRKLSGRKAYTRSRNVSNSGTQDFLGETDDVKEVLLAAVNAAIKPGHDSLFWRQMEPLFRVISAEDIDFLKKQRSLGSDLPTQPTGSLCRAITNKSELIDCKSGIGISSELENLSNFLVPRRDQKVIPLCQRLMAAFISETEVEGFHHIVEDDFNCDANGNGFELDMELDSEFLDQQSLANLQAFQKTFSNGFRAHPTQIYNNGLEFDELDFPAITNDEIISSFGNSLNGFHVDQKVVSEMCFSEHQYNQMSMDERLLLELQSVGIFLEPVPVPDLAHREDEEIQEDISRLEKKLQYQVTKKQKLLCEVEKSAMEARELQERDIERRAFDKLVGLTYNKYLARCGLSASYGKGAGSKIAKQTALSLVKQTLERCRKFEDFGESCFSEPVFLDLFRSASSHSKVSESLDSIVEGESANLNANTPSCSSEVRVSGLVSKHHIASHGQYHSDGLASINHFSEDTTNKGVSKVRKRELLLDDVVGGTFGTSLGANSGIGSSLSSGAKGKRSGRDREGKGNEMLQRNGTAKIGRPALGSLRGERKPKSKPKQRTTPLSASVNVLLSKNPEPPKSVSIPPPKPCAMTPDINIKKKNEMILDTSNLSEPLDLSDLPLPGMDELGIPNDLDGQGQDLDSWFNIDDEGLQDIDFMGLEIPMDDLSDLKMIG